MALDAVRVGRSPFGRDGSDCWDVDLILFHPGHDHLSTRRVCRYTIDVADVVPVLSGGERVWSVR
jgi:hypothetical protein